ncbi:hypothetical protein KKD70_00510 [Patescibacteria group bacterium]|nr:hypothetical protein [Patescibacteria group bacterium]
MAKITKTSKVVKTASKVSTTPKDVFLSLLMMVMLYICVISMLALAFTYIDYKYPDLLTYYPYGTLDSIRNSSSMLVVAFPLLLILSWFIQKDIKKVPAKHELKFRKWLTYLTLFIASITIVIDLIQLVRRFYGGELTLPFTLKVASVLLIAGAVFSYYVWDVQNAPQKSKVPMTVGWLSSFLVLSVLVMGFFVVGSPMKQREIRMDERRVSDLQTIQYQVIDYWIYKDVLPETTNDLQNSISGFVAPTDPETEQAYEYVVLEPLKFKLCTTFNQNNPYNDIKVSAEYPYAQKCDGYGNCSSYVNESWDYNAGYKCFERTIDPVLYPKAKVL